MEICRSFERAEDLLADDAAGAVGARGATARSSVPPPAVTLQRPPPRRSRPRDAAHRLGSWLQRLLQQRGVERLAAEDTQVMFRVEAHGRARAPPPRTSPVRSTVPAPPAPGVGSRFLQLRFLWRVESCQWIENGDPTPDRGRARARHGRSRRRRRAFPSDGCRLPARPWHLRAPSRAPPPMPADPPRRSRHRSELAVTTPILHPIPRSCDQSGPRRVLTRGRAKPAFSQRFSARGAPCASTVIAVAVRSASATMTAVPGMSDPEFKGASPNARFLVGEMPAPAQFKTELVAGHGRVARDPCAGPWGADLRLRPPTADRPDRRPTTNEKLDFIFLDQPKPGPGGGGGGRPKDPEPPRKAEIVAAKPPAPIPHPKPADLPTPPITVPIRPRQRSKRCPARSAGSIHRSSVPVPAEADAGRGIGTGTGSGVGEGSGGGFGGGVYEHRERRDLAHTDP